jgi:flagellar biosynthetic protein FliR
MPTIEPIFQHGIVLMLVAFRLAGVLLFSPIVASAGIPTRAKAFLVITLAAAVFPTIEPSWHASADMTLANIAPIMVTETLIGASVGFIASIPIVAMQLGGTIMGMQMGLGLAQIYDPMNGENSGVVDQLMFYLAAAVFLMLGGLDIMFMALIGTYESVPLGSMAMHAAPVELITGILSSGYELAMRVSAPVVAIMLLETVASGVLMKTIPQINILTIGFAIKIMAGLFGLIGALMAIEVVFTDELRSVMSQLTQWTGVPSSAAGVFGG